MGSYFFNSVISTALALIILLVVSLPASYVLARYKFKGKRILNTLLWLVCLSMLTTLIVPNILNVDGLG